MNLLDWLSANPVALGAIIGASGSVAAQLISALLNIRSASKRADLDRQDRALDRAAAERERFDVARREAFVKILQRVSRLGFELSDLPDFRALVRIETDLEELAQEIEVLSLLAPQAYPAAVSAHRQLAQVRDRLSMGEPLDKPQEWWSAFRTDCVNPMRESMVATLEAPRVELTKGKVVERG